LLTGKQKSNEGHRAQSGDRLIFPTDQVVTSNRTRPAYVVLPGKRCLPRPLTVNGDRIHYHKDAVATISYGLRQRKKDPESFSEVL
jgi:hypothetical protein